jgi:competence protein ComEA
MKSVWAAAGLVGFGIVIGLLAAGLVLLIASPPRGEAIRLLPPPTEANLNVHVSGAVVLPGVYSLAPGSRVREALSAAGGLLPEADEQALNQAALLQDGEMVQVPYKIDLQVTLPGGFPARSSGSDIGRLVDINLASAAELDALPGIGEELASRIIAYREANGPFKQIEEIQEVDGIGPGIFDEIKDMITVGAVP